MGEESSIFIELDAPFGERRRGLVVGDGDARAAGRFAEVLAGGEKGADRGVFGVTARDHGFHAGIDLQQPSDRLDAADRWMVRVNPLPSSEGTEIALPCQWTIEQEVAIPGPAHR